MSPDAALDGDPAVAPDGTGAWIIWSRRSGGKFRVMARHIRADLAMDNAVFVTRTGTAEAAPRAVGRAGSVWAAWESYEDGHNHIVIAVCRNGVWREPEPISDPASEAYRPSLAVSADGVVSVVWDGGPSQSYGVFLRQWTGGRWGAIARIPSDASLDAYAPRVAAMEGPQAWIVYAQNPERSADWGLRGPLGALAMTAPSRALSWTRHASPMTGLTCSPSRRGLPPPWRVSTRSVPSPS